MSHLDHTKTPPRANDDWPHCHECDTAPERRGLHIDYAMRVGEGTAMRPPIKMSSARECVDCARHIHTHEPVAYCPQGAVCGDCYHALVTTGDTTTKPAGRKIRPGSEKCPDCATPPWAAPTDLFAAAGVTA